MRIQAVVKGFLKLNDLSPMSHIRTKIIFLVIVNCVQSFGHCFLFEFSPHEINVYTILIFNVLYLKVIIFKYLDNSVDGAVVIQQLGEAGVVVMKQQIKRNAQATAGGQTASWVKRRYVERYQVKSKGDKKKEVRGVG